MVRKTIFSEVAKRCKKLRYFSSTKQSNDLNSQRWMQRHKKDPFVKRAQDESYRCRSAFKLLEIDDKFRILHPGDTVIDCGAAPGSWTQVAVERVNSNGTGSIGSFPVPAIEIKKNEVSFNSEVWKPIEAEHVLLQCRLHFWVSVSDEFKAKGLVIGIDLQPISPIEGAIFLPSCDFTTQETQAKVRSLIKAEKAQVILSDMAPSATGIKSHNHQVIVELCFSLLLFSLGVLQEDGTLLCKLWMGAQQKKLENAMKFVFKDVHIVKPVASRTESAEIFLLAQGFSRLKAS